MSKAVARWRRLSKSVWALRLKGFTLGEITYLDGVYSTRFGFGIFETKAKYSTAVGARKWIERQAAKMDVPVANPIKGF